MARTHAITIRVSEEEHEWLRRKAHWADTSAANVLRSHIRSLVAEEGYLRPPDDEPQDFGYEKEMIQFVLGVQKERD